MSSYRAVVIEGPGKAALKTREIPVPGPREALVRTAWQGICATDLEILDGTLGYYKNGTAKYPIVPGHEMSGRVAAVGADVKDLAAGDPVVVQCIQGCGACAACGADDPIACGQRRELGVMGLDGGYGEYVLVDAGFVRRVPPGISLRAASLAEPLAVACKGLRRLAAAWGPYPEPRRVAVIGAGAIGTLCALALKARGHEPVLVDRDPGRRALAARAALAAVEPPKSYRAYDAVIEATGSPEALASALADTRAGAALLLLGFPYDERPFSFESLVAYDKTVVGSVGSASRDWDEALRLLPRFSSLPLATEVFALEDYDKAWAAARAKGCLKAVLRLDPDA